MEAKDAALESWLTEHRGLPRQRSLRQLADAFAADTGIVVSHEWVGAVCDRLSIPRRRTRVRRKTKKQLQTKQRERQRNWMDEIRSDPAKHEAFLQRRRDQAAARKANRVAAS